METIDQVLTKYINKELDSEKVKAWASKRLEESVAFRENSLSLYYTINELAKPSLYGKLTKEKAKLLLNRLNLVKDYYVCN